MKIRNISPRGGLDVPLLGATVEVGEAVDVTPEQARALLAQHDNFAAADEEAARIVAELFSPAEETDDPPADVSSPKRSAARRAKTEGSLA